MQLKLSKDESNFTPIDEGQYEGVCFRVIDLGTREEQWKDSPPKKRTILHVSWEIQDSNNDNGEPHVLGKTYTASLNENSALFKDLKLWRGKPFTDDELAEFDVSKMIGAPAMLVVKHTDENKAKITDLFRPDVFKVKPTKNDSVIFDLTDYCKEVSGESNSDKMIKAYDNLPEWMQGLIKESFEFAAVADSYEEPAKQSLKDIVDAEEIDDDDVPF